MKSYKEITEDIRSTLTEEVSGIPLDILVGTLSMYVYEVQSNAVSQLLEGNLNTAININSIIAKAAQLGVSCPRITNPEVEFELTSTNASYELTPGTEVVSIGKFKFIFIGYIENSKLVENNVILNPSEPTLIRCLVTDKVTTKEVSQIPGDIYDVSISNVASKAFVYKNGQLLNVYDNYSDYLSDSGISKMYSVTYPDYGVKFTDEISGDISNYKIIYPNGFNTVTELVNIIKNKASNSNVLIPSTRNDRSQNIKLINLGTDLLPKTELVTYVETNLKLTQFIKSNTDIIAFFTSYLFKLYGVRYNVNYKLGSDLIIYVSYKYFNEISAPELVPRFYIGLNSITIKPGTELLSEVSIALNNQVSDEVTEQIEGYINEYNNKFNSVIDEYDLIYKINSINSLIHITEFNVSYSTQINYNGYLYTVKLSQDAYDEDVPNLDFQSTPDVNKTYKLYLDKSMFIKTIITWL